MNGVSALNEFFRILHLAMLEAMRGVQISGDAGWGRCGYRIDSYEDLAKGLYYCQIDTNHPETLIFEEAARSARCS